MKPEIHAPSFDQRSNKTNILWVLPLLGLFLSPFLAFSAETVLQIEQSTPDRQKAVKTAIQQLSQDLMEHFIEPSKLKAQKKTHTKNNISIF